ncbi:lantibiotic dehydratase [Nocardiopsis halotolerans]|uniref:lantibiotic dehydratase n=1 Tax=Nocardiopsis halotolerans TaxID=124252 RepID=UPI00034A4387|nr:lantibiotic dehydratase [Nocardiopsis halotolerans]
MSGADFGLIRVPVLSVAESARMVAAGDVHDPLTAMAVDLAADPHLRTAAASDERARASLLRYIARMGGRATPYGLFAGTAPLSVGDRRDLEVDRRDRHRVRVRVDVRVLEETVADALAGADPDDVPLRLNPSAHVGAETVRFAAPGDATATVVSVRRTGAIDTAVAVVGDAEMSTTAITGALVERLPGADPDRLRAFVRGLRDRGLLHPSDGLIGPGTEPADRAVRLLEAVGDRPRADALRGLLTDAAGEHPLDEGLRDRLDTAWDRAADRVSSPARTRRAERFDLHPELAMRTALLDRRTVADLRAAVRRVASLATSGTGPGIDMAAFRTAFSERYEDAEVPLLSALDLESGVLRPARRGASALAARAGLRAGSRPADVPVSPDLLDLLGRWTADGGPGSGGSVDIAHLPEGGTDGSRALLAVLLGDTDPGAHDGPHSMLVGGVGRAPHALLARFGLHRPAVADRIHEQVDRARADRRAARPEEEPLHAELVHHPGGRIGNVLLRPRVLDETIALTGAHAGTLHPDRLLLQLRPDGFRLRDSLTGRPVLVELNTAHNVDLHDLDPVYAVLGHLATSGGVGWSWGPLARLPHLPRVTCGRVIVTPERWVLTGGDVAAVLAAPSPAAALRRRLPGLGDRTWVGTGEYDHVLPVDLREDASVRAALDRAGNRATTFVEMPQAEAPAVRGPSGHHVAEVVVPTGPVLREPPRPGAGTMTLDRAHGRAWVYARLHCGHATADRVVSRAHRLSLDLRASGAADRWFFLRYQDGSGYHVRVRVRPAQPSARAGVLAAVDALGSQLAAEGLVTRTVLDEYVPEVARYGGAEGLRAAEALATASSDRVAAALPGLADESARLHQAVADITHWCAELFDTPEERQEFLRVCQSGLDVSATRAGNPLGKFARAHEADLRAHVARVRPDEHLAKALGALAAAQPTAAGPGALRSVFGSALHLHLNRTFAFDAVRMEYLAHELARRHLRRTDALERKKR